MARLDRVTPPRVLQVVLSLAPGGTERLVIELATRLHDTMPMAICCLDQEGAWAAEVRDKGIAVHALGRQPGFHPRLGGAIHAIAREHRATVIHAHHYSPFVYAALARLWRPSLRVIYTEHGRLSDAPPSRKRRLANALFSRLPTEVYTVSADLRQHIVAEGFPAAKVGVVYNGIDVQPVPSSSDRAAVRQELGVGEETIVIGTIARLDPVKDLNTMIEAVATLARRTPARLLVVGDGAERSRLERIAASTPQPSAFRFLGHRDDARRWLAGCDVYANSSIHEGVSLTILEAMSAALPIVATRVGGTPEIVDDSYGRLVPPRDSAAMADVLAALASDPASRRAMGAAARHQVEGRFTIERMVREYRDAYLRVS
jgi:glycosyltransferase involved in cell wall biosynthesis